MTLINSTINSSAISHEQNLRDLRASMFRWSLRLLVGTVQILILGVNLYIHPLPSDAVTFGLGLIIFCIAMYGLSQRYQNIALILFVVGLFTADILAYLSFRLPVFLYLFAFIGLVANLLWPRFVALCLVGIASAVILFSAGSITESVSALFLMWFTVLTNMIEFRSLRYMLDLALDYQQYAIEKMDEAREHRGELMQLTKTLQQTRADLEHANIQLRHAYNIAEDARHLKAQFAANVSHEFRTPINLIVGFSEMIVNAPLVYGARLPDAYLTDVNTIYDCAKHLQNLINDVLDISQIEAGYMSVVKEYADPRQVILEAAQLTRDLIESAGLTFDLILPEQLPKFWLDRTRIRQVLLNLLSNAVRFTTSGTITLQAAVEAKQLQITICDTGIGIGHDDLPHIFDEFYQTQDTITHRIGGSGLGLTLSKQFVALHNGQISVESSGVPGEGSQFVIALPLEGHTFAMSSERQMTDVPLNDDLFVVLDDDPAVFRMFQRYTKRHKALAAQTVEEAVELVKIVQPTAIAVNSEENADILLDVIRQSENRTLLIQYPWPSVRRRMQSYGVVDYLPKPVAQQELHAALKRIESPISTALIIDDNQDIVRMFSQMLQTVPTITEVWKAYSGQEGLALMRELRPDVIILDIMMPDIDGLSIVQIMKADPALRDIAIILASAHGESDNGMPIAQGRIWAEMPFGFQPMQIVHCVEALLDSMAWTSAPVP